MYLRRHRCADFRNISRLEFEPARSVNVICGENGHGKTNLLESIFMLTGARSFRMAKDLSLIKRDCGACRISSEFFSEGREQSIEITISEKGRSASLNKGTPIKASAAAGKVRCVVFSPEHLELVKGSPERRRRFIDTALCQISSAYLANLRVYTRLLGQRNSLLKDAQYVSAAGDMLDVYDERFAGAAAVITEARRAFIEQLKPIALSSYAAVSAERELLDFYYESTMFGEGGCSADEALIKLRESRAAEQRAGYSMSGPHRDDIALSLDGADARVFASQGQQRCIVLALKLAEAELMERRTEEKPILLLDDVLSELDEARRDCLIGSLDDTQAFITCCDPETVLERYHADARVFKMRDGELKGV